MGKLNSTIKALDKALAAARARRAEEAAIIGVEPDRLFAFHNTTPEGVKAASDLGGIPSPSLGVVPAGQKFDDFGNISLVAPREVVDPASGAKLFNADVYSPRQPRPKYKMSRKGADAMWNEMQPAFDATNSGQRWEAFDYIRDGEIERIHSNSEGLKLAALRARGGDIEIPTRLPKPRTVVGGDPELRDWLVANRNRVGDMRPGDDLWAEYSQKVREAYQRGNDARVAQYVAKHGDDGSDLVQNLRTLGDEDFGDDGLLHFGPGDRIKNDVFEVARAEPQIDGLALRDRLNSLVTDDEAWNYLKSQFERYSDGQFFEAGRRKIPYTLDNVSEWMSGRTRGREQTLVEGLGKSRSRGARQFDDIEKARAYAMENTLDADSARKVYSDLNDRMGEQADRVAYAYEDSWERMNDYSRAVGDVLSKGLTKGRARQALVSRDFTPTDGDVDALLELAREVKDAPVPYLEAKVQRPVLLREFGGAIVPDNTPQEVIDMLESNGLQVEKFGKTRHKSFALEALRDKAFSSGVLATGLGLGAATQTESSRASEQPPLNPILASAMAGVSAGTAAYLQESEQRQSRWDALRGDLLNAVDQAVQAIDMPWRGYLGLTRMGGGLLAGESFDQALNAGATQARQPLEQTAYELGGEVTDATGSPLAGTVVNTAVNVGGPI